MSVLIVLLPDALKAGVAIAVGAPTFAFILRVYVNWPPKQPFQFPAPGSKADQQSRWYG